MPLLTNPDDKTVDARTLVRERATALVFEDHTSCELLARIERLAPSEASVLITGETGTGKELVARHVHQLSKRSHRPFVALNCGALTESLIESELFGYEKGAFTGALTSRPGWFEEAHGGTLFLDEIGDLPFSMQVKLLRVLQEKEVVRLGARVSHPVDVRIIAATNINLFDAVAAGHFRADLFYRINVATLNLLPLRKRRGDIMPLAKHFVAQYCKRLGHSSAQISEAAEAALMAHQWPGNIRELENVIHYGLLVCRQGRIQAGDLHLSRLQVPAENSIAFSDGEKPSIESRLESLLAELFEEKRNGLYDSLENMLVKTAWNYCHGNQSRAARLLGISRNIFRARLARAGVIGAVDSISEEAWLSKAL